MCFVFFSPLPHIARLFLINLGMAMGVSSGCGLRKQCCLPIPGLVHEKDLCMRSSVFFCQLDENNLATSEDMF